MDNYLLAHLRKDGQATLVFSLGFALLGLCPWLIPQTDPSLRFAGLAAIACGLLGISIARGAVANPMSHPTVQELARYGPIPQVLADLQRESASGTRLGRLCLSKNWLTACGVGITVVRRADVARVEMAETRHRTGSNWRLVIHTKDGRSLDFPCRNHCLATSLLELLTSVDTPHDAR